MSAITRVTEFTSVLGQSGRRYLIERLLQDRAQRQVHLATSEGQRYILKHVPPKNFEYYGDMYDDLRSSSYIRVSEDAIPEHSMFAYKHLQDHLLNFFEKDVALPITRKILRGALRGIADMHDKGIVHTDIKANNIMMDWEEEDGKITVEQVQIIDIEDAVYVPEDCSIKGAQVGNWMWRSPEAHLGGPVHKPTDMFSFGIVCLYAVMKTLVLAVDEEKLPEGQHLLDTVFELQLSYFADLEGARGLVRHLGGSEAAQYVTMVANNFTHEKPRQPIQNWPWLDHDPEFRDLMIRMLCVDPARRLTAKGALAHPWFTMNCEDCEEK